MKQLRKKYCSKKSQQIIVENKLEFYKKIKTIGIDKIISIDESAFYLNMTRNFCRSEKGKRCYQTTNIYQKIQLYLRNEIW